MEIKQFTWNVVDSNSWLIIEGTHGLLIDVVDEQLLYDTIDELEDLTIFLTHSHFDHIAGLNKIRERPPKTTVISTRKCSEYLGNIYRNMSSTATAFIKFYDGGKSRNIVIKPFTCNPADLMFEEEMRIEWCGHEAGLISMHGHSDDSMLVVIDRKNVFSGDTLLNIPTVTRFPTGSKFRFWDEDVPKINKIIDAETVYPGHGKSGKLKDMLAVNKKPKNM